MENISTGAGLAVLGLGIVIHPLVANLAPSASASSSTVPAAAIAAAATAQAGGQPTVVWYGIGSDPTMSGSSAYNFMIDRIYRAWSDGTVEMKRVQYSKWTNGNFQPCFDGFTCASSWMVISSPTQGFKAAVDIDADEKVDGNDLAAVLSNWGDAPRVPFPPSDCPLNLLNP